MTIKFEDDKYILTRDDGTTEQLTKKTGDGYLFMPKDVVEATNRKLVSMAAIQKVTEFELTVRDAREPRILGPRNPNSIKKAIEPLENYLPEDTITVTITHANGNTKTEDTTLRALFVILKGKAEEARKIALTPKPLTELEKAQKAAEQAKAKYEALLAKQTIQK